LGESLTLPDASACRSVGELLELVAMHASAARGRAKRERADDTRSPEVSAGFVRVLGARPEGWAERRWPTLEELERASAGVAAVVMSFDHHTAVANRAAMALALGGAGLRAGQVVPPKGVVCVDGRGELTGELHEHAAYAAWEAAPEPTAAARRKNVLAALRLLRDLGFDEAHEMHAQSWLGPLLGELDREGVLEVRCRLYAPAARLREDAAGKDAWESEMVRLAGGKVFADGTLNSRTALMLHPYAEPSAEGGEFGRAMVTGEEVEGRVREAEELGLRLAIHAIGDGAVRMVLDAMERVRRGGGVVVGGEEGVCARHRVEHAEMVDEADVPRFAELGVVCSAQPCHLLTDVEVLTRQFAGRLDRVLPLRELLDAGCVAGRTLVFGSDAPIVRANPGDSVLAAVKRGRAGAGGAGGEVIGWEQRIGEEEAWSCFGCVRSEEGSTGIEGSRDQEIE
ncbi:MAG: amidohydrolase family protein, partial [Phycisphaeraceae bacterium]|nr:amidohydrolase family protein [Phycisphaeraceae bacterium]